MREQLLPTDFNADNFPSNSGAEIKPVNQDQEKSESNIADSVSGENDHDYDRFHHSTRTAEELGKTKSLEKPLTRIAEELRKIGSLEGLSTEIDEEESLKKEVAKIKEELERREPLEKKLKEREELVGKASKVIKRVERTEGIKELDPENLEGYDFEQLKRLGIAPEEIETKIAEFKSNELTISRLKSLKSLSEEEQIFRVNTLRKMQTVLLKNLNQQINKAKDDFIKKLIGETSPYGDYFNKIKAIEDDPSVLDKLFELATAENNKREQEIIQKCEETLREARRFLDSLTAKNKNALDKIEGIYKEDVRSYFVGGEDIKILIPKIVTRIVHEIMLKTGDEQKIKGEEDLITWKKNTGTQYKKLLEELNDPALNSAIEELVKREIQVGIDFKTKKDEQLAIDENLYSLFTSPNKVKYSDMVPPVTILESFDQRKKNDSKGYTEKILKYNASEEEKKEAKKGRIKAIVDKGGFEVAGGAVLVVKFISNKGNPTLKIIDAFGTGRKFVGNASPLDGSSFPVFIKAGLKKINIEDIPDEGKDSKPEVNSQDPQTSLD